MDIETRNEIQSMPCIWCGQELSKSLMQKRMHRKVEQVNVCKDCRDVRKPAAIKARKDKKIIHPEHGVMYCQIWDGDLNDDWLPIDKHGKLYRAGLRKCGLKDCVNVTHVIPPKVLQVTDIELIIGMHEMQQHNRKSKTR